MTSRSAASPNANVAARAGGATGMSSLGWTIVMSAITLTADTMQARDAAPAKRLDGAPFRAWRANSTATAVDEINAPAAEVTRRPVPDPSSRTAM